MNIQSITKLTKRFWSGVASFAVGEIRKRTASGKGVKNERLYNFPSYSEMYEVLKRRGMTRLTDGNKYKHLRGISTDRQVSPPNFSLRGWTMRDLSSRNTSKSSATLGWRGDYADIVEYHENKGKYVVGGMSDDELESVMVMMGKQFDFNWNKNVKNKTVTLKL